MDEELLRIIDLFDNDEVTTADKIDPPENPYRDFMDRNPQAKGGRIELNEGTKKYDYTNPRKKNQYLTRTDEEIQAIINDPKYKDFRRKDFRNEGILTRAETDRETLKFKNFGKRKNKPENIENVKRTKRIKETQGSNISVKGSGQTGRQFSHVYPLITSAKPGTKTTFTIDASMNRKLEPYNKIGQSIAEEQEFLIKNKPEGYKNKLVELNAKAKKNVMNAINDLGKKYKGQIGYFQVDPETGEFKNKAGNYKMSFAGIEGENKIYKDMSGKERKDFERKISLIQKNKNTASTITKLNAKIPGVTELFEMAKSIPDDIKRAKYLKAGFKTLGIAAAPLVIYDTYNAYKEGKPILETLEQGIIGTDIIGGTKRFLALTPEEKEARSVVKQDALKDLNVDMPMGFGFIEGPDPMSDLTLEEAQAQAAAGDERVKALEAQKNFERATDRSNFFSNIKDKALGIGPDYQLELAGGGIAGLSGGIDEGPQRTSMNPDSQGLRSLKNRVRNL